MLQAGAFVAAVGVCAFTAAGQGTLLVSHQQAQAEATYRIGSTTFGNSGSQTDNTGIDFNAIETQSFAFGGYSGRGYAQEAVMFNPSSPMIGNQFDTAVLEACTSAEIFTSNIGAHTTETAHGLAIGIIEFSVSEPMGWSWVGAWQGWTQSTPGFYAVGGELLLEDVNTSFAHVSQTRLSINGSAGWQETFAYGGVLNPGVYRLLWSHESLVMGGNTPFGFYPDGEGGAPLISCVNSTFHLFPIPAPGSMGLFAVAAAVLRRRR
ncbi:MAG: hypothetical protein GIKADHBN_01967 [Phycisphaerales bacterium]|nr:hypothetical protein [Phycisphaerales bacterium]